MNLPRADICQPFRLKFAPTSPKSGILRIPLITECRSMFVQIRTKRVSLVNGFSQRVSIEVGENMDKGKLVFSTATFRELSVIKHVSVTRQTRISFADYDGNSSRIVSTSTTIRSKHATPRTDRSIGYELDVDGIRRGNRLCRRFCACQRSGRSAEAACSRHGRIQLLPRIALSADRTVRQNGWPDLGLGAAAWRDTASL